MDNYGSFYDQMVVACGDDGAASGMSPGKGYVFLSHGINIILPSIV